MPEHPVHGMGMGPSDGQDVPMLLSLEYFSSSIFVVTRQSTLRLCLSAAYRVSSAIQIGPVHID